MVEKKVNIQKRSNEGNVGTRSENKFRFQTYIDKLSNIDIKIDDMTGFIHSDKINNDYSDIYVEITDEYNTKELKETQFSENIRYWESCVRYDEFTSYIKLIRPYIHSLPHILIHLTIIIDTLAEGLIQCEYPETAEAISRLFGVLAKDTRVELVPNLPKIFLALSKRLNKPLKNSSVTGFGGVGEFNEQVLEGIFSSISTIFFYLSKYILIDLEKYIIMFEDWIFHPKSLVRTFTAESIAYALRKADIKDVKKAINIISIYILKQSFKWEKNKLEDLSEWVSDVLFTSVKSINGGITTKGNIIIKYCLKQIYFGITYDSSIINIEKINKSFGVLSDFFNSVDEDLDVITANFETKLEYYLYKHKYHDFFECVITNLYRKLRINILQGKNEPVFVEQACLLLSVYLELFYLACTYEIYQNNENTNSQDKDDQFELYIVKISKLCGIIAQWYSGNGEYNQIISENTKINIILIILLPIQNGWLNLLTKNSKDIKLLIVSLKLIIEKVIIENLSGKEKFLQRLTIKLRGIEEIDEITYELRSLNNNFWRLNKTFEFNQKDFLSDSDNNSSWTWFHLLLNCCNDTESLELVSFDLLNTIGEYFDWECKPVEYEKLFIIVKQLVKSVISKYKDMNIKLVLKFYQIINLYLSIGTPKDPKIVGILRSPIIFFSKHDDLVKMLIDISINVLKRGFIIFEEPQSGIECKSIINKDNDIFFKETLQEVLITLELITRLQCNKVYDITNKGNELFSLLQKAYSQILTVFIIPSEFTAQPFVLKFPLNIINKYPNLSEVGYLTLLKLFLRLFMELDIPLLTLDDLLYNILIWLDIDVKNLEKPSILVHDPKLLSLEIKLSENLIEVLDIFLIYDILKKREFISTDTKLLEKFKILALYWIQNPSQKIRLDTLQIFIKILESFDFQNEELRANLSFLLNIVYLLYNLEATSNTIENERIKIRYIQQICDNIYTNITTINSSKYLLYSFELAIRCILSQFYVKFSVLWQPCIDNITRIAKIIIGNKKSFVNSKELIGLIWECSLSLIYINTLKIKMDIDCYESLYTDHFTVHEMAWKVLQNLYTINIEPLKQYEFVVLFWVFQLSCEISGNIDYMNVLNSYNNPEMKLKFYIPSCKLPSTEKGLISRLNNSLKTLQYILSNFEIFIEKVKIEGNEVIDISYYDTNDRSSEHIQESFDFLLNILCDNLTSHLLSINYPELQIEIINIISKWGNYSNYISPYTDMLKSLVNSDSSNENTLRSNLLMYPLYLDKDTIQKEHRLVVIPLVIRLILSKLSKNRECVRNKNRGGVRTINRKSGRKLLFSYLSQLPNNEIGLILSILFEPILSVCILNDPAENFSEYKYENKKLKVDPLLYNKINNITLIKNNSLDSPLHTTYQDDFIKIYGQKKELILYDLINQNENCSTLDTLSKWLWSDSIGFMYTGTILESDISNKEFIVKIYSVKIDIMNNSLKIAIKFLVLLEDILDQMPHNLRMYIANILILVVNIFYQVCKDEVKYDYSESESKDEFQTLSREDEIDLIENLYTSEVSRLSSSRFRLIIRILLNRIRSIIFRYPELNKEWIYILKPIAKILQSIFNKSISGSGTFQLSAIMCFMLEIFENPSLYKLLPNIFPDVLRTLCTSISSKAVITYTKNHSFEKFQPSGPVVSLIVKSFLYMLYGGKAKFEIFKQENDKKMNLNINLGGDQDFLSDIESDTYNNDIQSKHLKTRKEGLICKSGFLLLSRFIPELLKSFEILIGVRYKTNKVNYELNNKINKSVSLISDEELLLLMTIAQINFQGKLGVMPEYEDDKIEQNSTKFLLSKNILGEYNSNCVIIVRLILLLLLSSVAKVTSRSIKITYQLIQLLRTLSGLLKHNLFESLQFTNDIVASRKYNDLEFTLDIEENMNKLTQLLLTDESQVNLTIFIIDSLILISRISSLLLLKNSELLIRMSLSEIILLAEMQLMGFGDNLQAEYIKFKNVVKEYQIDSEKEFIDDDPITENMGIWFPSRESNTNIKDNCERSKLVLTEDSNEKWYVFISHLVFCLNIQQHGNVTPIPDINLQIQLLIRFTEYLFGENQRNKFVCSDNDIPIQSLLPLICQLINFIGTSHSDFTVRQMSMKLIVKFLESWINRINYELEKYQDLGDPNTLYCRKSVLLFYKLVTKIIVTEEHKMLKFSNDLSIKRCAIELIGTRVELIGHLEFAKVAKILNTNAYNLMEEFHLEFYPILKYCETNEKNYVNIFEEIVHIQKHRRARALNYLGRFAKWCKDNKEKLNNSRDSFENKQPCFFLDQYPICNSITSYTVKNIGIPLCIDALLQRSSSKESYHLGLGDNSLRALEYLTPYLTWRECIYLTSNLVKLLRVLPQRKTYIIKAICIVLNSFDFHIQESLLSEHALRFLEKSNIEKSLLRSEGSETEFEGDVSLDKSIDEEVVGELTEVQNSLRMRLLPMLRFLMVDKSNNILSSYDDNHTNNPISKLEKSSTTVNYGLIRPEIVLVTLKILKCLPDKQFHSELPRLVNQLIIALKSKDRETRRRSRAALKSVCDTLGIDYLPWIFSQMSETLTKGYQLSVLSFTVHSILKEVISNHKNRLKNTEYGIYENSEEFILDSCVQHLAPLISSELNRIADPDRRTALEIIDTPVTSKVDECKFVRCPEIMKLISEYVSIDGINKIFRFLYGLLNGTWGDRDGSIISDAYSQKYLHWIKQLIIQSCAGFIKNRNICTLNKLDFSVKLLALSLNFDPKMKRDKKVHEIINILEPLYSSKYLDNFEILIDEMKVMSEDLSLSSINSGLQKVIQKKDQIFMIQPGAASGRGVHQIIKPKRGYEQKIQGIVLGQSALYILNYILKEVRINKLYEDLQSCDSITSINTSLSYLIPLATLAFLSSSHEVVTISSRCLLRLITLESFNKGSRSSVEPLQENNTMNSKVFDIEITLYSLLDKCGPIIAKNVVSIMERSSVSSSNALNSITDLTSSCLKLLVALLLRHSSSEWFNSIIWIKDKNLTQLSPFYINLLRQLHICVNDRRLRLASLQLIRQVILYGKSSISASSESLGSLYSLVDSILPLLVQYSSVEPKLVRLGSCIYAEFLLYYPMSDKAQRQRISILLENLPSYSTSEGRQAILFALYTLVTRLPAQLIIESYSIMITCGLTLYLSNETDSKCVSMVEFIINDILNIYGTNKRGRFQLITLLINMLEPLYEKLCIKRCLITTLRMILGFFQNKKLENKLQHELKQYLEIVFVQLYRCVNSFEYQENTLICKSYRLQYESYLLLENLLGDSVSETEFFDNWLSEKSQSDISNQENQIIQISDMWKVIWENVTNIGLSSCHLWVRASSIRITLKAFKYCLNIGECDNFKVSIIFRVCLGDSQIFGKLFNKIIVHLFDPVVENASWLCPIILSCAHYGTLLSGHLDSSWKPPSKSVNGKNKISSTESETQEFQSLEKKTYKKIDILEENEVTESDWLIIENGEYEDEFNIENDDIDNEMDNYLSSKIPEIPKDTQNKKNKILMESHTLDESDDNQWLCCRSEKSEIVPKVIPKESKVSKPFWWILNRVAWHCRLYTTEPGKFKVRLLLNLKFLYDFSQWLPQYTEELIFNEYSNKALRHSIKALFQCSTIIHSNPNSPLDSIIIDNPKNISWITRIGHLSVQEVIRNFCWLSQRALEEWDRQFSLMGHSTILYKYLFEARQEILTLRNKRKTQLKLDLVKRPEVVARRRSSKRLKIRLLNKKKSQKHKQKRLEGVK
ncbi:hypothetical protein cand_026420 [Cryptosporidium andersoni]|uniref:U3 small nucleolar RNA-associated protein 20 domain-containing protein n=1 Tax=Cryptosporidium andersoni TaxID=117008 RepID=A0A1J4MDI7_9CRYT|nr:hypothetical protein cand_026420 [Cryptosporidium andersoni]